MPRNSRSSKSSASIVTLVSSSPFHQPAPSCSDSRCATAASRVARASGVTARPLLRSGASVTSALSRNDEAAQCDELVARGLLEVSGHQRVLADSQAATCFLAGPGASARGLYQRSGRGDLVVAVR